MTTRRQILVTSALPYANGAIHLGHLVGYIQADIWCRFQRMRAHECYYICGDDAHGTPIMLRAEAEGISPETLIERMRSEHLADFTDFHIQFDNYYTTHSPENKQLAETIYQALLARGDIERRTILQAFDDTKQLFLPDRFIKGTCPRCGAADQYGDNCEACGATYTPSELIDARSALTGTTPIEKPSEHYFFKLGHHQDFLETWLAEDRLQSEVANKLKEWVHTALQDWDISRDAPYFGFAIPGTENKYFYVWLDAPIGYMASFLNFCQQQLKDPSLFDAFWRPGTQTELHHFIGKDIIYFHALFWPAMLKGANFRLPTQITANGFLTVNGQKMSKSRGTFIRARDYLAHLNPECLRYYFASRLSAKTEDLDLQFDEFTQRVNADLVGKVINIASRCAGFIHKYFEGKLSSTCADEALWQTFTQAEVEIAEHYEHKQYSRALRVIMALADDLNRYIDHHKPWVLAKQSESLPQVHDVCSLGLNGFRLLILYLKPVLPQIAAATEIFFNIPPMQWSDSQQHLRNHTIQTFQPLLQRIDPKSIDALKQQLQVQSTEVSA